MFDLSFLTADAAADVPGRSFPNVILRTRDGEPVRFYDDLLKDLGWDVRLLSITVDPAHDTPAVLNAYANQHGARSGWYYLTGSRREVETLQAVLGARDRFNEGPHTSLLVYANADTGQWGCAPAQGNPRLIVRSVMRLVELARHQAWRVWRGRRYCTAICPTKVFWLFGAFTQ
jgi:SCO1/SenC